MLHTFSRQNEYNCVAPMLFYYCWRAPQRHSAFYCIYVLFSYPRLYSLIHMRRPLGPQAMHKYQLAPNKKITASATDCSLCWRISQEEMKAVHSTITSRARGRHRPGCISFQGVRGWILFSSCTASSLVLRRMCSWRKGERKNSFRIYKV